MDSPSLPGARAAAVHEIFSAVARRYDFLNHLLSAGLDRRWRQRAARLCGDPACGDAGPVVLDLCTGTGDMALAILGRLPGSRVIACDFCRPMLARARAKFGRANLAHRAGVLEADALALPLADASVDAAVCALGLRNLADPARGLAEMVRVVRHGGRVVILEFHRPPGRRMLSGALALYFRRILPRLGDGLSRNRRGGYAYLAASIDAFGPAERTCAAMAEAGLAKVRMEPLPGGIASVFCGFRP